MNDFSAAVLPTELQPEFADPTPEQAAFLRDITAVIAKHGMLIHTCACGAMMIGKLPDELKGGSFHLFEEDHILWGVEIGRSLN